MLAHCLNQDWKIKNLRTLETKTGDIPCSVISCFSEKNQIYTDSQESRILSLSEDDYLFEKIFNVTDEILRYGNIELSFDGIDTICEVYLNDNLLFSSCNMHIQNRANVKSLLKLTNNLLKVYINSPLKYISPKQLEKPLYYGNDFTVQGFAYLRKTHCMFGWDWCPKYPDLGIWRDVKLECFDYAKILDYTVVQDTDENKSSITVSVEIEKFCKDDILCQVEFEYEGETIYKEIKTIESKDDFSFIIENPKLWYLNGLGEQLLYNFKISLYRDSTLTDIKKQKIGLKKLTINFNDDKFGKSFTINNNGKETFAFGANIIPEDIVFPNISREKTRYNLESCKKANMNCIRVWGGGYYPDDYFYELCEEMGIAVWQDLMFACANYPRDELFIKNIEQEITYNVKRTKNKTALLLYCGNNEMEDEQCWIENPAGMPAKATYAIIFCYIIPNLMKKIVPHLFFWQSSPCSGGDMDNPQNEKVGDYHYWKHLQSHQFEDIFNYRFRFLSEYGIESVCSIFTLNKYVAQEALNLDSKIFWERVKNPHIKKIMANYLDFRYLPYDNNIQSFINRTQASQSDYLRIIIEHMRRNNDICKGSLLWQLNDVWPAFSHSLIDYDGRYKPSYYTVKKAYSPVIASIKLDGVKASYYLCSELYEDVEYSFEALLMDNSGNELRRDFAKIQSSNPCANVIFKVDYSEELKRVGECNSFLVYRLFDSNGICIYETTHMLVLPKNFNFSDCDVTAKIVEHNGSACVYLQSNGYMPYTFVEFEENINLDINNVDLIPNEEYYLPIYGRTYNECRTLIPLIRHLLSD